MSKKQKKNKNNKRMEALINAKIQKKFGKSFMYIILGFAIMTILAFANIMIYAGIAKVGIFSTPSRAVGILLLVLLLSPSSCLTRQSSRL